MILLTEHDPLCQHWEGAEVEMSQQYAVISKRETILERQQQMLDFVV